MADANKPDPAEVKRELLKKLEEIDLSSLTELGGKTSDAKEAEAAAGDWWVWTVWRR